MQLRKKLEINPNDVQALIYLGVMESRLCENLELGIALLEKAVEADPSSNEAKFWLAVFCYYNFGYYEKAEALLKEILKVAPDSPECWSVLERLVYEADGPLETVIDYTKKALALAPNWPFLHNDLANFLISAGNYEDAKKSINDYKKSVDFYRAHPVTISNPVEWYYENVITGRGVTDIDDALKRMEARLEDLHQTF